MAYNLVLAATRQLDAAEQGHGVELIDLVALGLSLYTPGGRSGGTRA